MHEKTTNGQTKTFRPSVFQTVLVSVPGLIITFNLFGILIFRRNWPIDWTFILFLSIGLFALFVFPFLLRRNYLRIDSKGVSYRGSRDLVVNSIPKDQIVEVVYVEYFPNAKSVPWSYIDVFGTEKDGERQHIRINLVLYGPKDLKEILRIMSDNFDVIRR